MTLRDKPTLPGNEIYHMKIAIKYGLMITLVVVIWVLITHFLFPISPESKINIVGPILFNLAAIVAIYLGVKSRDDVSALSFKEGLKTGVSISFVYTLSASLFFFGLFLFIGPQLMANEPMAQNYPVWQRALVAFAGLFFGALILGLVYSTIISFLLVRRERS